MDYSEVRKLVKLVESSDIQELELEREGTRIRVTRPSPEVEYVTATAAPIGATAAPAAPVPASAPSEGAATEEAPARSYHEIKSPMVGTFYRAPQPDADPYIQVGDSVKAGQTLCIVEAMKLMNEIESDVTGKVVEIVAGNGDPVEFGQVLVLIDPQG